MSDERGPWRDDEPPEPAPPRSEPGRGRALFWILLAGGLAALVFALMRAFPEAVRTSEDWMNVGYGVGLVLLISAGLSRLPRTGVRQHLRHAALWVAIVGVLAVLVAYGDVFTSLPQRLKFAFSDGAPVATSEHEMIVPRTADGAFVVVGQVNGQRVRFVLDTGASETVLSPDDARRLGLDPDRLDYRYQAETANGLGYGAPFTAERLQVGPIGFDDFPMVVNKAPMSVSLLGLSFVRRLESFEVRGDRLILRGRPGD